MFNGIGNFIKNKRIELGVSLEKLSSGLCSKVVLSNFENGKVDKDKFFIDTILQRLGVSEDYFEHYITCKDYAIQELRFAILDSIFHNDYETLEELLKSYSKEKCFCDIIHQQFCEYAKILKLKQQNVDKITIIDQYKKVILMTVPNFLNNQMKYLSLSVMEIAMLIDYAELSDDENLCLNLLACLQQNNIEKGIKVRTFPKLVCLISHKMMEQEKLISLLNLCDKAIELLRDEGKFYYLTDLLRIKMQLEQKLHKETDNRIVEWYDFLTQFYEEYSIKPNDEKDIIYQNFRWQNYILIGDVIKRRRKMLGLSQEQLAENICDVKTISRLENNRTIPYPKIVKQVLEKLNLVGEIYSDTITYHNYETFRLCRDITNDMILQKYTSAKEKNELFKEKLDLCNRVNLQRYRFNEVILERYLNKVEEKEILFKLNEILNLTIPLKNIYTNKNWYFSKNEITILINILNILERLQKTDAMKTLIGIFESYFKEEKFNTIYFSTYSFSMVAVQSIYGNMGEFKKSNEITKKIIDKSHEVHYFTKFHRLLYSKAWNYKTEIEQKTQLNLTQKKEYMKLLEASYILSDIIKDYAVRDFIKTKM